MKHIVAIFDKIYRLCWNFTNQRLFIKLGNKSYIYDSLKLTKRYVSCGNNVMIWKNCRIEGISEYENIKYNPIIVIDDNVTIQQHLHLTCANNIFIGKNTAIASNVTISDINHPYEDILLPPEKQQLKINEVYIGEDCKIYNNAVILAGTYLGKHNIVAANSVVSGSYPDYCVIAGNPARIIRKYDLEKGKWV